MSSYMHNAATCVVATAYESPCVDQVKNELCLLICCCEKFPYEPNKNKLKQVCVDRLMAAKKTYERGILSAVPFNMTKTPPEVLQNKYDSLFTNIPKWKKLVCDDEVDAWKLANAGNVEKKHIRIPDVVVLKDPAGKIDQANIEKIYEIKFPPDDWKPGQKRDYQEIAGSPPPDKVEKIGPKECLCEKQDLARQPVTAEARQQANALAEAADRKLRELMRDVGRDPMADFDAPDAADIWQEMWWNDFTEEYPNLSKAAYPAILVLMGLAAVKGRGGGRMPTLRWPASGGPVPAGI